MLLSLVFWNWLAVMPRRSIFAVLVRWLGISWAVVTDSVWSRRQCMIYFRWLMLGQCHNLHSLSSQLANFLDDRLPFVYIVGILGSWTSVCSLASCQHFPWHLCQYSMHLIAILREVMWRMLFVSLYFSWNPCEDAADTSVLELVCCDASKINICSLSSMAWNIMGCCSRFCLVSPAVHDLFQVIDARTMPQLALTEQPTCESLGWQITLCS